VVGGTFFDTSIITEMPRCFDEVAMITVKGARKNLNVGLATPDAGSSAVVAPVGNKTGQVPVFRR